MHLIDEEVERLKRAIQEGLDDVAAERVMDSAELDRALDNEFGCLPKATC